MPGCKSLSFQVIADDIVAHALQMFSQIGTGVVDRRADKGFDVLLFCNHVASLQVLDLSAKVLIVKSCEPSQELTMEKVGLHRLYRWRPSARFGCLAVFAFCGILTACPTALIFEGQMWEAPSIEIRMQVDANLSVCALDESELPNGWSPKLPQAFPPYQKPVPTGMLGGILIVYSNQEDSVWHELEFYERSYQAVYSYTMRRIVHLSRWHRTWVPLDLSQANLSADQYRAKCSDFLANGGPASGEKSCAVKARYGRFISAFRTYVSPRDMSMEEFVQVLQAIDRNMLQCIDSFADKKWESQDSEQK